MKLRKKRGSEGPLGKISGNQLAGTTAFGQGKEIILPLSVSMGAKIRRLHSIAADHADIDLVARGAVDGVEGFLFGIDATDGFFAPGAHSAER
jgi:hypothetical protein